MYVKNLSFDKFKEIFNYQLKSEVIFDIKEIGAYSDE